MRPWFRMFILVLVLLSLSFVSFPAAIAEEQPPYAYINYLDCPSSVKAEETFEVSVTVDFWFVDPTGAYRQLLVSINEADNRTKGDPYPSWTPDLAHVKDTVSLEDPSLPHGKGTRTYNLTVRSPEMEGPWHLVAETYIISRREFRLFDKRNFEITIMKVPAPVPTGPEILLNGGFESGFDWWEERAYGDGEVDLSSTVAHQGDHSLVIRSMFSPSCSCSPNGGEVHQIIERPDLTFDMNFSFWVYPWYVIQKSTSDVRASIAFRTDEETFRIYYYVSWHDRTALRNESDVAIFLLENCRVNTWNFVERDLKSDFEAVFGSSSQYGISKVDVYLDLRLFFFSMLCPEAYWDEVAIASMQAPPPPSTYMATISVSGIGSGDAANVRVDGVSASSIVPGESKSFEFDIGTSHTLTVDPYVTGGVGIRYYCSSGSWSFSSSGSHVFEYATQYYLEVASEYGETKGSGWYDSGSTATFSVAPSSIEMSGIEGLLGGRYVFDHWTLDSDAATPEATIVMDEPKSVEAVWRIDTTSLFLLAVALICTLGVVVIVGAMVIRKKSRGAQRVKPAKRPSIHSASTV